MKIMDRIEALRKEMLVHGMSAYIIPSDDYHGSEYVGDYFRARAYMSGFTGSAGTLVVLPDKAALWTDGRYFLQAENQLAGTEIQLMRFGQDGVLTIADYLAEQLKKEAVIGFDGRTMTNHFVKQIAKKTDAKQIKFRDDLDLVGQIWKNRPKLSKKPVWELDIAYAGYSREEKLLKVRQSMKEKGADVLLLTALDEIAYLLNLRGNDVAYTPVFLSYMMITENSAVLFLHEEIISEDICKKLSRAGITIRPYDMVDETLSAIESSKSVWLDDSKVNYHLNKCLKNGITKMIGASPVEHMKAIKTPEEIENIRKAHIKDGVAVTKFIYWLKKQIQKRSMQQDESGIDSDGDITEIYAAQKLLEFRKKMEGFLDQSFEPIIAYGAHGAIVHYAPAKDTDIVMEPKGFCLMDTGGHYMEGTTDVTRTIALGPLTEEEKRMYTVVLRGNLTLGAAVFPEGTCGQNLDALARKPLWENGLDFNHGTGHGVGYLLNVHEGPQRISYHLKRDEQYTPLEAGMVTSNEPGIYLAGKFGIRLENLVLCRHFKENEFGRFFNFETLTMVPFDQDAIVPDLLSDQELIWLNAYHRKVYDTLSPYFEGEELTWLSKMTEEIQKS